MPNEDAQQTGGGPEHVSLVDGSSEEMVGGATESSSRRGSASYTTTHFRSLLRLTLAFMCVFCAFQPLQALQSSLNAEGGVGNVCLSLIYAFLCVTGFIAPVLVKRFGERGALAGGCLTYVVGHRKLHPGLKAPRFQPLNLRVCTLLSI